MIAGALRPSEALRTRDGEIDLKKKRLVKPTATMKSKREHIVPLSSIALEVLERRDRVRVRTGDEKVDAAALYSPTSRAARSTTLCSRWRRSERGSTASAARIRGGRSFATGRPPSAALTAISPSWRSLIRSVRPSGLISGIRRPSRGARSWRAYGRWLMDDRAGVIAFPTVARA